MAESYVAGVRVAGIAAAVPAATAGLSEAEAAFGSDAKKIAQSTGVRQRHVAPDSVCTSDLCCAAANKLLAELQWEPETIDILAFVSQTPDYFLPATACSLHGRLGLAKGCAAFDVSLGCSGYVYGLWLVHHLAASAGSKRVLLLAGDTITKLTSPVDRTVATLFGDAGTATALERTNTPLPEAFFSLGSDGAGSHHLVVPAGGFRLRRNEATGCRTPREAGNVRSDEELFMDGAEVFSFTLREVPQMVKAVMTSARWSGADVDGFVFHQANKFMLDHLAKKMKLPAGRVPLSLGDYGNTSSASIPLTIVDSLRSTITGRSMKLVMSGFGVGLSWGAAALDVGPICVPALITIGDTISDSNDSND